MDYLSNLKNFNMLSLQDLLAARDMFHFQLVNKPNVIATAVGRYLIRKNDKWPTGHDDTVMNTAASRAERGGKPKEPRYLTNSEVRPYSWPCILVFVKEWIEEDKFSNGAQSPADMVPKTIFMPDGTAVPVCVVAAPPEEIAPPPPDRMVFPDNLIGGGYPVIADVQGEEYRASLGCIVTDGHTHYALTNRHVSGRPGEELYTLLRGQKTYIGKSSDKQLTREPFEEVYDRWPGKRVYVNLDVGLIEIDDLNCWTAQVYGIGLLDQLADLSVDNISLRLIGCPVRAYGCASGEIVGEIRALFYRYKSLGGFEYVSDFLIGPRQNAPDDAPPFITQHGDSGTLWLMEEDRQRPRPSGAAPTGDDSNNGKDGKDDKDSKDGDDVVLRPIAVQWGGQVFLDGAGKQRHPYALATCLSTICNKLEVDLVRDWHIGVNDYWGAVGHYTIANRACDFIANPQLRKLMLANLENITYQVTDINDKNMKGLSNKPFVPLADVPDYVWKIGPHARGGMHSPEHGNHFADIDRPRPSDGKTLLELCEGHPENVSVPVWQQYYTEIKDESRGLLPFRVWQFYQSMVEFAKKGDINSFVCAAGIVSHYVGDACQPLHISYMFNGDPDNPVPAQVRVHGQAQTQMLPKGAGVHSAYEDDMVNYHIVEIQHGIDGIVAGHSAPLPTVQGGHAAAAATVDLMQHTFDKVKPADIVAAYVQLQGQQDHSKRQIADGLWGQFGEGTTQAIAEGCRYLAMIWDSAWKEGNGDANSGPNDLKAVSQTALEKLYQDPEFLHSYTLDTIQPVLQDGGTHSSTNGRRRRSGGSSEDGQSQQPSTGRGRRRTPSK